MYEIPQELEYQEKIIFGLTFGQLAYAMMFLPIGLLIFTKLNVSIYLRVSLAAIPCLIGAGFMFFDLRKKIQDYVTWMRYIDIRDTNKFQKLFGEIKVENDLIITKKNKLAVLKVLPINFSIKPQAEQDAIILAFQKFLNSLSFPIQILMTTEKIDLDSYISGLSENVDKGELLQKIFQDCNEHLKKLVRENEAVNRSFYIVIPQKDDISIQIKICEDRLLNLNLRSYRLKDPQLKMLISQMFSQNKEIFPEKVKNLIDFVKIGDDKYQRVIYAHGYPRMVESGFLDKIVSTSGNFDFSLHITPISLENSMVMLNRELQKQRADLYAAKIKNQLNPSLEIKYEDTRKTLESLQKGHEAFFNFSLYINCRANSQEELDFLTRKIESELNSLLIIPRRANFRMIQGIKSCLPIGDNALKITRNITTSPLSAFFCFTSSFFQFDKKGIWLGINKNNIPIIRDIFSLPNANGLCLASSGSGKSYLSKLLISRYLVNGTKVIVIDPQGEYRGLVDKFKGQRIDLSRTSNTIINPMDLMGHEYPEKRLTLMNLMPVMLGELTEPQKSFIDKAITDAYERKGIFVNDPESWQNTPPILEDVLKSLQRLEKTAITLEKATIRSLINRIDLYVNGVFSFLNRHTSIDFSSKFVCFDIGNMPKQVKPIIMFLILDYVYMKMKSDLTRKLLVVDEAWSLLSRAEEASYIFEIVKTCRKFNLGLLLINQEVEDMLNSKAGRSVLANSSYTLLLKQKPAVIDDIQKTFRLSNSEKNHLLTASVGEGVLLVGDEHTEIKIVASKEENDYITTNADELLSKKTIVKPNKINFPKPKINIDLDLNKGLFKLKELKEEEIKYLQKEKFKEHIGYSIISGKKENYFLKVRNGESPQHAFLVYDLANYIKKFTDKVEIYQTTKPDIVFKINNQTYALEVETGKLLTNNKKQLKEKVKLLNETYKNNWFFVVTDKKLAPEYKQFGKTIDKRSISSKITNLCKKAK